MRRHVLIPCSMLALLAWGALARAQAPTEPVFVPVPATPTTEPAPSAALPETVATPGVEAVYAPDYEHAPAAELNPPPPPDKVKRGLFGRHGICCWTTHYTLGCSSLKSECKFIFGSCRTFYGEPCLGAPPRELRPPGYQQGRGTRDAEGRSGCPCEQ